ncbi:uncharacterized protein LOC101237403 [Hydra vulgaris]|uniref:Uncharacterized protein LOC101237403 n=1 Tax=Hydra vulgaris TaxID=6087 RepID=A0ABM4BJ97_HYDVU
MSYSFIFMFWKSLLDIRMVLIEIKENILKFRLMVFVGVTVTLALLFMQIFVLLCTKKWCETRQRLSINDELKTIVIPEQDYNEIEPSNIIRRQPPLNATTAYLAPLLGKNQGVNNNNRFEVSENVERYVIDVEPSKHCNEYSADEYRRKLGVRGDGYSFIFS